MKKPGIVIISLFLIFLSIGSAPAQIYKWVDENGVTHFSDRPPSSTVPKDRLELMPSIPSGSQSNTDSDRTTRIRSDSEPHPEPAVELFVTNWCIYCKKARAFFQSRGIPFTEHDIEKDKTAAIRKNRLDKKRGVPFAIINGQPVHGFSEAAYERALQRSR